MTPPVDLGLTNFDLHLFGALRPVGTAPHLQINTYTDHGTYADITGELDGYPVGGQELDDGSIHLTVMVSPNIYKLVFSGFVAEVVPPGGSSSRLMTGSAYGVYIGPHIGWPRGHGAYPGYSPPPTFQFYGFGRQTIP